MNICIKQTACSRQRSRFTTTAHYSPPIDGQSMATSSAASGLIPIGKDESMLLKSVSVDAQVRGFVMGLRSTLTYSNDSPDPVEVLFRFPVEKSHAVVGLAAVIDGRKIAAIPFTISSSHT